MGKDLMNRPRTDSAAGAKLHCLEYDAVHRPSTAQERRKTMPCHCGSGARPRAHQRRRRARELALPLPLPRPGDRRPALLSLASLA